MAAAEGQSHAFNLSCMLLKPAFKHRFGLAFSLEIQFNMDCCQRCSRRPGLAGQRTLLQPLLLGHVLQDPSCQSL
jgi:hypothetical protein